MKRLTTADNYARPPIKLGFCWKVTLLSVVGGIVLAGFFFLPATLGLLNPGKPRLTDFFWHGFKEMLALVGMGALFTGFFGAPSLLVIDKHFSRSTMRYLMGGLVVGAMAWLVTIVPLFLFQDFPGREEQIPLVLIFFGIYTLLGLIVGAVFTGLVWLAERRMRSAAPEAEDGAETK